MEKRNIKVKDLEVNKGQIFGLPKNPRFIRDHRFAALKKSIEDAPEMLAYRTLLVYPNNGKFVIICGNMRFRACKDIGYAELPCTILPEDTPVAKLREYTIKDNIGFGSDDMDALANEWEMDELNSWGFELPAAMSGEEVDAEDYGDSFTLPNEGKAEFGTMTFVVNDNQSGFINDCISLARNCEGYDVSDNKNENGAALYLICKEWFSRFGYTEKPFGVVEKEYKELREYLYNALKESGKKCADVDKLLGTSGMSGHYFGESQWMFPTREAYNKLKTIMTLDRDYMECKLKEYAYNRAKKIQDMKNKYNGTL